MGEVEARNAPIALEVIGIRGGAAVHSVPAVTTFAHVLGVGVGDDVGKAFPRLVVERELEGIVTTTPRVPVIEGWRDIGVGLAGGDNGCI